MLPKLSVKKPMTIFVAVVLVLVLGFVSFFKMTPDLLPNLDFPYAIIMTTYPGQTPETVEMTVSKPLEQSMSTIDGVKKITSNSAENYSVLMMEFEDGTNMDTATVDVRSSLDTISDNWPDGVGTPYLIKINPNMLPVALVAVNYDGKSSSELSDYVSNTLLNKLEQIDGIASVSDKGIITERENIVLSQKKIDKLNKKISAALDDQFGEADDKLNKAKQELNDNISKAKNGAGTISESIDQINAQQDEVASQLSAAQGSTESGKTQILSAKMQLLDQKAALVSTKESLEQTYQCLLEAQTAYKMLIEQKESLTETIGVLTEVYEAYKNIISQLEKLPPDSEEYKMFEKALKQLEEQLKPFEITPEELEKTLEAATEALQLVEESLESIESMLSSMNIDPQLLDSSLKEALEGIAKIDAGIAEIDKAIEGLDNKSVTVDAALATISKQQSNANFKMSAALSTLISKQSEVNSAVTQLNSAQDKIQESVDELTKQKQQAKDKANMNNTLTLDMVSGVLTAQNFSMPAGYVSDDDNNKYMVRVGDEISSEKELKSLVLFDTGIDGIGVVKLSEVADIFISDNSDETYARINGAPGIILSFSKSSNTASATVCENINKKLEALSKDTKGLDFTNLYNEGDYISIVIGSVLQNLLMGAILAIIILFLFLRDIKPTIIVACSIPISVVFAIVLMYFSGVSLNMISLSGLAIGVGMLVDNSVVVIENIYRLRGMGVSAVKAALNGAKQVSGAIFASTLTTVCVFLPIVFVEGITRQIFVDMALTIAYSLLASLIVALTLVPAMSQSMLRKMKPVKDINESKIMKAYEKSLRFVLRHRALSLLVAVALLFTSTGLALARGFSFMPKMSSTQIQVTVKLDDNATFEETVDTAEQINKKLGKYNEFETVGVLVGGSSSLMGISGGGASSDAGNIMAYCVLKDDFTKQSDSLSRKIEKDLKGIKGDVTVGGGSTGAMSAMLGDGSIQVVLYGEELKVLQNTAVDMTKKLEELKCVKSADSGIGATSPEIKITVNKQKAISKGLTVAQVFQQVAAAVADEKTSTTLKGENGDKMNIVVVKDESNKVTSDNVNGIEIEYTDKETNKKKITLSSIAEISESETMNIITRQDQKRYLKVSAYVEDNFTVTKASNEIKTFLKDYKLPEGCSIEYSGTDKETMDAVFQMLQMLALGIVLIYLVMVAQFQSLKSPFIIMFTIPLAFTGGFLGLVFTGFDVSVVSLLGFVMLCGIIVNNGIVLVDYINRLRIEGKERREAIVEAGKTRMRPILITALTTVLGLSVMALGIGTGAEMMQPVAIVCIGGLIYATFMTLFIIPVIYDMFNKKELRNIEEADLEAIDD